MCKWNKTPGLGSLWKSLRFVVPDDSLISTIIFPFVLLLFLVSLSKFSLVGSKVNRYCLSPSPGDDYNDQHRIILSGKPSRVRSYLPIPWFRSFLIPSSALANSKSTTKANVSLIHNLIIEKPPSINSENR